MQTTHEETRNTDNLLYAPSARIVAVESVDISDGARTVLRLAVKANFYAPEGEKDVGFFRAGDWVNIKMFDEANWPGARIAGRIVAIDADASTADVAFDSAMPEDVLTSTAPLIMHFQTGLPLEQWTPNMLSYGSLPSS